MRVVAILLVILMAEGLSQARAGTQPLVDLNWLTTHLDRPGTVIVDTRSRAEFEAAHIPGAVHTDYGRGRLAGNERRRNTGDVPRCRRKPPRAR